MSSIEIHSLSKVYSSHFLRRFHALKDVDLEIGENEIFGFLGPNGAGKTTTLKIVTGLIQPTKGSVRILDSPLSDVSIRERVGFLPEHPSYYTHLTGYEVLDFAGGLFSIPAEERKRRILLLLERVGLSSSRNEKVSKFSKGMVQRLGIAQALINDPELVILDEPLSGLDPLGRKELKDIIVSLKREGKTVFFSTHILSDVERICDRVAILHRGRLINVGTLSELLFNRERDVVITFDIETKGEPSFLEGISPTAEGYWNVSVPQDEKRKVEEKILENGGAIVSIIPDSVSLEDFFVSEIKKDET
jgi:ABC-2 type transport system ATP-binding protein